MDLGNGFTVSLEGAGAVIEKDREDTHDKVVLNATQKAALIAYLQNGRAQASPSKS